MLSHCLCFITSWNTWKAPPYSWPWICIPIICKWRWRRRASRRVSFQGLYQLKKMSYSLWNTPWLMKRVLNGYTEMIWFEYINDIIYYIYAVLQKLTHANITLNMKRCQLQTASVVLGLCCRGARSLSRCRENSSGFRRSSCPSSASKY